MYLHHALPAPQAPQTKRRSSSRRSSLPPVRETRLQRRLVVGCSGICKSNRGPPARQRARAKRNGERPRAFSLLTSILERPARRARPRGALEIAAPETATMVGRRDGCMGDPTCALIESRWRSRWSLLAFRDMKLLFFTDNPSTWFIRFLIIILL